MYSGVLLDAPLTTLSCEGSASMIGVALGVVGELSWVSREVSFLSGKAAKSTSSAGGPSTRRASMSFWESETGFVKGFLTSLATLMITSKPVACSAVGSK